MRRIEKATNSKIVEQNLLYKENGDNRKLAELLRVEQLNLCAYTEVYLGRALKAEIDHFNPLPEFKERNEYNNLFLCNAVWNNEKSNKWNKYQPILHPTSSELEQRIAYFNGNYYAKDENDIESKNLIKLIKLDDFKLANDRKKYIQRIKIHSESSNKSIQEFLVWSIKEQIETVYFLRAIQEEFGVDVEKMLREDVDII
ncbi:MAG TPA: HNH endonuclease domain-containing protein [Saprospiraceae bacterium]|nr:HNH endonuclease domain-containing protein [Saprospiraceae bacterium]HUN16055.1 HNH endonuclease domain-containing protein [Saprospiraceae bacterium]